MPSGSFSILENMQCLIELLLGQMPKGISLHQAPYRRVVGEEGAYFCNVFVGYHHVSNHLTLPVRNTHCLSAQLFAHQEQQENF